jgi:2,5-diamino-6-(ribosylamino)-4(3H)-pyrimidinone 5'-phosphate reductase
MLIEMMPKVIIHNAVSADGRNTGFIPNLQQYYELTMTWKVDATLAGSETILQGPEMFGEEIPEEDDSVFEKPSSDQDGSILVIPDSQGKVRMWHYLKKQDFWDRFVALVSESTPREYLEYLEKRHIDYIQVGKDKVDIRTALLELNERYGVEVVRADSGGTLNGILFRAGLVSELSILVSPILVGGADPSTIFKDLGIEDELIELRLTHHEKLDGGTVWLRYAVRYHEA